MGRSVSLLCSVLPYNTHAPTVLQVSQKQSFLFHTTLASFLLTAKCPPAPRDRVCILITVKCTKQFPYLPISELLDAVSRVGFGSWFLPLLLIVAAVTVWVRMWACAVWSWEVIRMLWQERQPYQGQARNLKGQSLLSCVAKPACALEAGDRLVSLDRKHFEKSELTIKKIPTSPDLVQEIFSTSILQSQHPHLEKNYALAPTILILFWHNSVRVKVSGFN